MLQIGSSAEEVSGRRLLQAGTTPVTTAAELQNAVAIGAKHIVVLEHLDLSPLTPAEQNVVLGAALSSTLSITVRPCRFPMYCGLNSRPVDKLECTCCYCLVMECHVSGVFPMGLEGEGRRSQRVPLAARLSGAAQNHWTACTAAHSIAFKLKHESCLSVARHWTGQACHLSCKITLCLPSQCVSANRYVLMSESRASLSYQTHAHCYGWSGNPCRCD